MSSKLQGGEKLKKSSSPSVVIKRHQIEPEQEYPAAIPGLLPQQRKNAVISPDLENGWVEVYWLDVEYPKKPQYNYPMIAAALALFLLAAYLLSGVLL
jgi:hypothetical protein